MSIFGGLVARGELGNFDARLPFEWLLGGLWPWEPSCIFFDKDSKMPAVQTQFEDFHSRIKLDEDDDWSCPCNSGHADTVRLMTPHYA